MMIDLALIQRIRARVVELLSLPNETAGLSALRLRLDTSRSTKDMPWHPRIPKFTPKDLELLRDLRRELTDELGSASIISDSDIVYLALLKLELALKSLDREGEILRLRYRLAESNAKRNDA